MLSVENLTVRSGDFELKDVTLFLEQGQCGVVVGPSGAGKSTLLETIVGLRKAEKGRIILNGREITDLPPENRGIAFVPQDYALFPHLTARGNILLAPKLLKMPKDKLVKRFDFLCGLLGLRELLDRRPKQLSGGERQRVALARALMLDPQLLLLDEPFAALDPQMRPSVRRSIRQIFRTLKTTVLIVTHDLWDAAALGDKVFVLENGRVIQSGSWSEIITNPQSDFIAEFVGINRFTGEVVRRDGRTFLRVRGNLLPIQTDLPTGTVASLKFFPSQVELVPPTAEAWRGRVDEVMNLGDRVQLVISVADSLPARIEAPSPCHYEIGDEVTFIVKGSVLPLKEV